MHGVGKIGNRSRERLGLRLNSNTMPVGEIVIFDKAIGALPCALIPLESLLLVVNKIIAEDKIAHVGVIASGVAIAAIPGVTSIGEIGHQVRAIAVCAEAIPTHSVVGIERRRSTAVEQYQVRSEVFPGDWPLVPVEIVERNRKVAHPSGVGGIDGLSTTGRGTVGVDLQILKAACRRAGSIREDGIGCRTDDRRRPIQKMYIPVREKG